MRPLLLIVCWILAVVLIGPGCGGDDEAEVAPPKKRNKPTTKSAPPTDPGDIGDPDGGEADTIEADLSTPRGAVKVYGEAVAADDIDDMMATLVQEKSEQTRKMLEELKKKGPKKYEQMTKMMLGMFKEVIAGIEFEEESIDGDKAELVYVNKEKGITLTIQLAKEGDDWKIDNVDSQQKLVTFDGLFSTELPDSVLDEDDVSEEGLKDILKAYIAAARVPDTDDMLKHCSVLVHEWIKAKPAIGAAAPQHILARTQAILGARFWKLEIEGVGAKLKFEKGTMAGYVNMIYEDEDWKMYSVVVTKF